MTRPFALAVAALALAAPARGSDDAPETLLAPTTQLYARWDGVSAHNEAYKKSVWGPVMAGPTGDNVRALLAKGPRLFGSSLVADPLLSGRDPGELKANLADLKAVDKLVDLLADRGVIVAAEVREPAPSLKGVGSALTGLLGGKAPKADALVPDAHLLVIVPGAADKAGALNGAVRLLMRLGENKVEAFAAKGRTGYRFVLPKEGAPPFPLFAAWWGEGAHFVFYAGTRAPEAVMDEFTANAAKGGLTASPLYQRAAKLGEFESVARGFVDTGRVVGLAKSFAGPFVPGLNDRLNGVGLGSLKAVVFSSGFDGKESRAVYELDTPGERKGFARALKNEPLGLNDLPPMPPDVSRFSALRLDPAATYDAGLSLVEFLKAGGAFGVEGDKKGLVPARKEYLASEADKFLGVRVRDDIIPHLGDKLVLFQSPTEGLSLFGQVVCVSCKDPAKIKAATDNIQRALEGIANSPIKVRKKVLKGVEVREFYARGFGVVTPTYAIVGEWLVVGGHPQAVQGFVLRAKGALDKWAPDAETAKRLAKLSQDGCGLQFCNPKSTTQNLCCVGPMFLSTLELRNRFRENNESDFDPIDVGLVPNAHELSRHLFPNLTVTRNDGKTIRIETNESFSLPLEFLGLEPLALAAVSALN
ncbi:hypothetical protein GobsT_72330 [Gemmata obscuriglobus]|uniref:DUF3352 domain-containing protein n=1 Tax=Gemmata obscuriglobus TaxID=114 RepID=A0A2Z3HBC1_9BACT|nr:hypothetical protein [Gemmata obscuriglobus]AWM41682.1 hypothetical protein C1280_34925 [Gemmata obscuriglobus]QEG32378.1 hypothetical protein GobsT_72330 [Gemmata obscuriglobus]VTS11734.1 Uncharacterized protein OS=Planctomyces brasiliensis (strain ATCC 49424 / DSM 5305 / JCM 21570 / NBRC 103401 / IFAM 1448) GN=Plabr_4569 PE=4 SV=1 [Gemmata obscuriglobus UQM 2246]